MKLETHHRAVLDYVNERNYVSFSTLKCLRDGRDPSIRFEAKHFDIGTEVHSRWMEKTVITKFDGEDEKMIKGMVKALQADKVASMLLKGAQVEVEFNELVDGVMTHGFIDILPPKKLIGDLKTTRHTSRKAFIESIDFLQAALYLRVAKRDDFYFIGVCKSYPYPVFTFRVSDYPDKLNQAREELKELLAYLKLNLKNESKDQNKSEGKGKGK